jgi:hypothetical protein
MNTVEVTGSPGVSGNVGTPEDPWYIWTFPVIVNGEAGLASVGFPSNDGADEPIIEEGLIQDLEQDASDLGGISENDPGTDMQDQQDQQDMGDFSDDDDDMAVAGNDGGDFGDSV